jgi:hypothetical protein
MDELVGLVVKKTGISENQAEKAVEVVIGYLKDKLPEPLAGQIDGFLEGEGAQGSIDDIAKGLGGLLGK